MILRFAAVLAVLFGCGCRAPLPRAVEQSRELAALEESRVVAFRHGQELHLRFRIKGRDARARAVLPDKSGEAAAVMDFSREAVEGHAAAEKTGARLPVFNAHVWKAMSRGVASELAPAAPGQCVVVSTGGQELFVCRSVDGEAGFSALKDRPSGLRISRRVTAAELVPRLLGAFTARHGGRPALLLTGQSPPALFFNPAARTIVFLFAPPEETLKVPLLGASPDVTVRGVLSLGLRSGVIATLKNPFTTALHGSANLLSMTDALVHSLVTAPPSAPPPPVVPRAPMDIAAFEKRLDRITGEPLVPATVRLRIDGEQFFPDFIQAVQEARESVDILLYIWDTDDYALQIADLVKEKSKHVRVRVMIDEIASLQSSVLPAVFPNAPGHVAPSSIVQYLRRDSNTEVRPMAMPALTSTHSKMIIIDGRLAWLGGMNIGREYRSDWHDMMIEVTGPLLGWMQKTFDRCWAHHGWGGDLAEMAAQLRSGRKAAARIPVPAGAIPVRPLYGTAIHSDIKTSQFAALRAAQQRIWLENSYLTDSHYIHELIQARHRGLDVRVILPEENDSPLIKLSNKALIPRLLRHGIRVWTVPEMSHVKAAIYDGWATVGSANYDRLSFRVNQEFNIGYSDPATVETLRRDLFLKDMDRGRELLSVPETSPAQNLADSLIQLLASQL